MKHSDLRQILETSLLNLFGFFNRNVRKQKGEKLIAFNNHRAKSPTSAKMINIDNKYGGKPKAGQMVREGHYPKFSEMID